MSSLPPIRPRATAAFTLVEVMVVVAILAILAAIAIPNYTEAIARGARKDAKTALTLAAQWIENNQSRSRQFHKTQDGKDVTLPTALAQAPESGTVRYTIALTNGTAATYTLTATPTGSQANDACGPFRVDQTGARCLVDSKASGNDCTGHTTSGALFDR